jgi:hypothetical protein
LLTRSNLILAVSMFPPADLTLASETEMWQNTTDILICLSDQKVFDRVVILLNIYIVLLYNLFFHMRVNILICSISSNTNEGLIMSGIGLVLVC